MKYANVIFDMDGVLIDNSAGIMHSVRYALGRLGVAVPDETVLRKFIGPALVWSLKTYCHLSEADAERGLKIYREMYSAEGINMYRLYDGVYDTVKTLAIGGVRLSVASGKPQIFLDKILETSGMSRFFERTAGVDFTEKESSKAAQIHRALISRPALMVGDRIFDIDCARGEDVDCAFAKYGFGDESDYAEHKPRYFIDQPSDLLGIVFG